VGGDAIVNFADIFFADFGVALHEVHERIYAGRWAVCSERVVDIDRGEDVFPGQREEGAGDEGSSSARLSTMSP
jgi:hypothetical protein